MASRRYTQFGPRKIKAHKAPSLSSGANVGRQEIKETTGPYKPVGGDGSGSGFNRGVNFPALKAYVKKSGL